MTRTDDDIRADLWIVRSKTDANEVGAAIARLHLDMEQVLPELASLRRVVQAVRELEARARREWAKRDYMGAAVVTADQLHAALAAAADAPQPDPATKETQR